MFLLVTQVAPLFLYDVLQAPMSVSDFCNMSKKFEKVSIRSGAVMGREMSRPEVTVGKHMVTPRAPGGNDYARQYVEEEERHLLKVVDTLCFLLLPLVQIFHWLLCELQCS